MEEYKENVCTCNVCQDMCRRPCWPTPEEAQAIIDKGFGERLMKDWWVNHPDDIFILAPAYPGYEDMGAPENLMFVKGCTFFKDGLCELHDLGLKPFEGRMATHEKAHEKLHKHVAMKWDNPEAQMLCNKWGG